MIKLHSALPFLFILLGFFFFWQPCMAVSPTAVSSACTGKVKVATYINDDNFFVVYILHNEEPIYIAFDNTTLWRVNNIFCLHNMIFLTGNGASKLSGAALTAENGTFKLRHLLPVSGGYMLTTKGKSTSVTQLVRAFINEQYEQVKIIFNLPFQWRGTNKSMQTQFTIDPYQTTTLPPFQWPQYIDIAGALQGPITAMSSCLDARTGAEYSAISYTDKKGKPYTAVYSEVIYSAASTPPAYVFTLPYVVTNSACYNGVTYLSGELPHQVHTITRATNTFVIEKTAPPPTIFTIRY